MKAKLALLLGNLGDLKEIAPNCDKEDLLLILKQLEGRNYNLIDNSKVQVREVYIASLENPNLPLAQWIKLGQHFINNKEFTTTYQFTTDYIDKAFKTWINHPHQKNNEAFAFILKYYIQTTSAQPYAFYEPFLKEINQVLNQSEAQFRAYFFELLPSLTSANMSHLEHLFGVIYRIFSTKKFAHLIEDELISWVKKEFKKYNTITIIKSQRDNNYIRNYYDEDMNPSDLPISQLKINFSGLLKYEIDSREPILNKKDIALIKAMSKQAGKDLTLKEAQTLKIKLNKKLTKKT